MFYDNYSWIDLSLINFQMKKHYQYKQSFMLFYVMIYATFTTSITTRLYKKTTTELRFSKGFHQDSHAFKCREFADSNNHG